MLEYKALAQPVLYFTKILSYCVGVMSPVGIKQKSLSQTNIGLLQGSNKDL